MTNKVQDKTTKGKRFLDQSVFDSTTDSKDRIIITVVNTGSGIKERTEKDLIKMLLEEDESAN